MHYSLRIEETQKENWENYAENNNFDSLAALIRYSVQKEMQDDEEKVLDELDDLIERVERSTALQRELKNTLNIVDQEVPRIEDIEDVLAETEYTIVQELQEGEE